MFRLFNSQNQENKVIIKLCESRATLDVYLVLTYYAGVISRDVKRANCETLESVFREMKHILNTIRTDQIIRRSCVRGVRYLSLPLV